MRKRVMMLSCIAAVAIASFVGKKAFEPHAYETNNLLLQNVEALADGGEYDYPDGYAYTSKCNVRISKYRKCQVEIISCQGGGSGCNTVDCPTHPRHL